jgi:hypothetical protein
MSEKKIYFLIVVKIICRTKIKMDRQINSKHKSFKKHKLIPNPIRKPFPNDLGGFNLTLGLTFLYP